MSDGPMPPGAENVADMSPTVRMQIAVQRAAPMLGPEVGAKLLSFLTPEALAAFASFVALAAVAQLSPIGWIADAAAAGVGALVLVGAWGLGKDIVGGMTDLKDFVTLSRSAQTDAELNTAAQHLARAVSTLGIDTLQAIMLHKAVKEPNPKAVVEKTVEDARATQGAAAPGPCIPCEQAAARAAAEKVVAEQGGKIAASAAEKVLIPDPAEPFQRNRLATRFYEENGKPPEDIMSHRDGIDMTKPVSVKELQPGDTIVRWEFPGRGLKPGASDTYASYLGQDPAKMGINMTWEDPATGQSVSRQPVLYRVTQATQVLESTAKDLPTPVGVPTVGGKGGALQLWMPDTAGLVKQ